MLLLFVVVRTPLVAGIGTLEGIGGIFHSTLSLTRDKPLKLPILKNIVFR